MGDPTAEEFESWLHPCDVIEYYHQERQIDPQGYVSSLLADGFLRAAANPLVLNGRNHGLALIPRELWEVAGDSEVWVEGRFRFTWVRSPNTVIVSAWDVRIDRNIQAIPNSTKPDTPAPIQTSEDRRPLPDALLTQWGSVFFAANPDATEVAARRAIDASFPSHQVSRQRLRRIMPERRRGRPLKNSD